MSTRHVVFGALFGFLLVRAGATSYDAIAGMFRLEDLHLVGVIVLAIATSAIGFALLRRRGVARGGAKLALETKPVKAGLVPGALLFGVGWALTGACPGTAIAQLGEGRLAGAITLAGIVLGAWLEQRGVVHTTPGRPVSPGPAAPVAPSLPSTS